MNPEDRMTIELLNNYAYIFHEDVTKLTNREIDEARKFASEYTKNSYVYKEYNPQFEFFVNKQRFFAVTSFDYDILEKNLYDTLKHVNDAFNINNWNFRVYYDVDYSDYFLLGNVDKNGIVDGLKLKYNIKTEEISKCDIPISSYTRIMGNLCYHATDIEDINILSKGSSLNTTLDFYKNEIDDKDFENADIDVKI